MLKEKILAYALENALSHKGKAKAEAVLSKLFREGLRKEEIKKVLPEIKKVINSGEQNA